MPAEERANVTLAPGIHIMKRKSGKQDKLCRLSERKSRKIWLQWSAFLAGFTFVAPVFADDSHSAATTTTTAAAAAAGNVAVMDMDLEALMKIEVMSPGKKPEKLSDVAAAIYVITQED